MVVPSVDWTFFIVSPFANMRKLLTTHSIPCGKRKNGKEKPFSPLASTRLGRAHELERGLEDEGGILPHGESQPERLSHTRNKLVSLLGLLYETSSFYGRVEENVQRESGGAVSRSYLSH